MIRSEVKKVLDQFFTDGVAEGLWSDKAAGKYTVELPKHEGQGDFSTNFALVLAGIEKKNPRQLAATIAEKMSSQS